MKTTVRKSKAGFTLIEVMICVAIIGILVAVALPQFNRFTATAKRAEGYQFLQGIYTTEATYFAANDAYTTNIITLWTEAFLDATPKYYLVDLPWFQSANRKYGFGVAAIGNIDRDATQDILGLVVGSQAGLVGTYWQGRNNGIYIEQDDLRF